MVQQTARQPGVLSDTFAALGDPTRMEIVSRLSHGAATVSELAEPFPMSLRAVLKHIEVLEAADLVRTTKTGRTRRCELRPERIAQADDYMRDVRRRWERRIDRLETLVRRQEQR